MEEDYAEHIKNKALLSYDYREDTESLCEYLAEEIGRMGAVRELKGKMDGVLSVLSEEERFLLELRYFGRKKRLSEYCGRSVCESVGSERNYYRRQERLLRKTAHLLRREGVTEDYFFREYGGIDWLISVYRYIESGRERGVSVREKSLFRFLADKGQSKRAGAWLQRRQKRGIKKERLSAQSSDS